MRSSEPADVPPTELSVDEPAWRVARQAAPTWTPRPVHTLVVAPHPDDEILMFAALMVHQQKAGAPVEVLAVTDGDAAYGPGSDPTLAALRRSEQNAALNTLADRARPSIGITRLGIPDGEVAKATSEVIQAIADLSQPDGIIAAPWQLDHHCDHEAVGRAAKEAALGLGRQLVQGLFWAWHHRTPESLDRPLRSLPLDSATAARRAEALACHQSQLRRYGAAPVLEKHTLLPMNWDAEYHLVEPSDAH